MSGLKAKLARVYGRFAGLPHRLHSAEVAPPANVRHGQWENYLSAHFNKPGLRVLEIGSRNVTGVNLRNRFDRADYVGFDFYAGENVDVVGDAHRLTSYFEPEEKFDLIFSSAVFEHFHMPWVVATEISRLLKLGGTVFVETHFSYSAHERPWNFFQFSDVGLRALFNRALGFELIEHGMSNPIAGFFAADADAYLRFQPVVELYCHSEILVRKVADVHDFDWASVAMDDVVDGSRYPKPKEAA